MNEHLKYIEGLTSQALDLVGCENPPVPVGEMAKKLDLSVVEFDFSENISGVLKKEKKVIGVNKKHHPLRQRFTIAHEMGHFLLGHELGKDEDFIEDDTLRKPTSLEREANVFASFLLMPREWIRDRVKKLGVDGQTIRTLAREFEVSEQAVTIRLLELDLIK